MSKSLQIVIPETHYLGRVLEHEATVPLGFLTPDGTDKAAEKRKETVDRWASSRYGNRTPLEPLTLKNEPQTGFSFGSTVRHGYGSNRGDTKWRVTDPRGFELEINSSNLRQIIADCTIEQDVIRETCIWARCGTENVLVPIHSQEYLNSVANTVRKSKSASLKDAKVGDTLILQNGYRGQYLGTYYELDWDYGDGYRYSTQVSAPYYLRKIGNKRHLILRDDNTVFGGASLKLAEIVEGSALSKSEAFRLLCEHATNDIWLPEKDTPCNFAFVHLNGRKYWSGEMSLVIDTGSSEMIYFPYLYLRDDDVIGTGRYIDRSSLMTHRAIISVPSGSVDHFGRKTDKVAHLKASDLQIGIDNLKQLAIVIEYEGEKFISKRHFY